MKKSLCCVLLFYFCLVSYAQQYSDSLIHFILVKNVKDTIQNENSVTWQDLHTLSAKIKLHALTAKYGVTHPKGIIFFEVFCNTKSGWGSAGTTEISFLLTASILTEPIGVYSYLKMKRASGKIQIKIKKITLISTSEKNIELYFSEQIAKTFYLIGKDSTW